MKSLLEGLPSEIAKQIHPDWRKNEADYWVQRDELFTHYRNQWVGFADGRVIVSGTSPVEVFHAAQASGQHPFVTCVGHEDEPSRMRRAAFSYDTSYPNEPLPVVTVEFRKQEGSSGLQGEPTNQVLSDLMAVARDTLGHHIDEVQQQLYELDRSSKLNIGDRLNMGKDRVLSSINRELELLVHLPTLPVDLSVAFFVDLSRLDELRQIKSTQFDLRRLVRLCEELNVVFQSSSFHAVAMLTRAILDHIPPIFGFDSFAKVANQYKGTKSFRDVSRHLDESTRKVADALLHEQIRRKEVLPNQQQVDAHQSLDVVLAEVVRLLS